MPADDLLLPTAERVTLALGGGLGAIVAVERHRLRSLTRSTLFIRWRTWLIAAPIYGAAVMWSRWGTVVFAAALAAQGAREYARMAALPRPTTRALVAGAALTPFIVGVAPGAWGLLPAAAVLAFSLLPLTADDVEHGSRALSDAVFGYAWIPWFASTIVLLRDAKGPGLLLALGTAAAASDVFAFVAGRLGGRASLAPRISPAKTRAGVAGNLAGAYAGFGLLAFAAGPMPLARRWGLPALIALGCVWGDLLESLVKRRFGVKDAGSWLPGFGGLLDRIDSLLIVLPLTYAAVSM